MPKIIGIGRAGIDSSVSGNMVNVIISPPITPIIDAIVANKLPLTAALPTKRL